MKVFNLKAFRDFKQFGWRSILIIFILILSIGGSLGFIYVLLASDPWLETYFDDVNHPDYVYQLEDSTWINQNQLDGLDDLSVINDYTGRLFWRSSLKLEGVDEVKYILLVGLDPSIDHPKVFDYTLKSGKNFNDNDESELSVVIDKDFAERNDLKKGDTLTLASLNDAELKLSGLCNAPEFLSMTSNPEYSMPIQGSMTVGYLSKDILKKYIVNYFQYLNTTTLEDFTSMIYYYQSIDYNNIAVTFKQDVDDSKGDKAIEDYFDNLNINIETAEKFQDMYAYDNFHEDMENAKSFTTIILIFMLLMGLFITFVIFNRYIFNQKQQLGTLSSFGYTKRDIDKYFSHIFWLISAITIPFSIIIGYIFGWAILGVIVGNAANLSLNELEFLFLPEIIYIGVGVGLFIILASIYLPVRKIKRMVVADLIYGKSESRIFMIKFKKEDKPKKKVSQVLIHRNLFRHKKRLVFTTMAMTFSLLIISATQTVIDSMDYNINRVFKSEKNGFQANENWDLNVDFQGSINLSIPDNTIDKISDIKDIKETQKYVKGLVTAKGEEDQTFLLIGFDAENTNMHHFTWDSDQKINSIPEKDNEIVISYGNAEDLDKKVGDDLKIETSEGLEFTFKIVGVHKELMSSAYCTLNAGREIFHNNSNVADALYVLLEDDADKNRIIDKIYDLENIEIIFDSEVMGDKLEEYFNDFIPLMLMVVAYSLLVSFFIIFYNSVMNIYDKNYEYGILRSLGFPKRKNFRLILGENMTQGSIAIALALLFTYPLSLQLAAIFGTGAFEVVIGINAISYIIIPPLILIFLGSLASMRTIYKFNLYEQVQTRFIG
ncbi:MAG: ABC transporter permease [Promethearchaeota archaeon]